MHLLDFFPPIAHSQVPASLAPQLEWGHDASILMVDLPLRYIFQAALSHLQEADDRQVLMVTTTSKDTLQEHLFHEQHLYAPHEPSTSQWPLPNDHDLSETTTTASKERLLDPWRHLFPCSTRDLGRGVDEEFSTATQLTQDAHAPTPTTASSREPGSHAEGPIGRNSSSLDPGPSHSHIPQHHFQPDLWARIQLRYAPSLEHAQSFFQCLHLDADAMQGKTLGDNVAGCVAPNPTLVMLVGCFQDGEVFGSEPDQVHDDDDVVDDRREDRNRGRGEASRLCVLSKGMQMDGSVTRAEAQYPEDMRADAIAREEDRIRLEYLRLAGQTMSEVKDGLEWIERESHRKPRLMVFEDSSSSDRRLWLEKVLGYWTETLVTVEEWSQEDDGRTEGTDQEEEERDSFRMWFKTHSRPGQRALLGSTSEDAPGVLGVEWRYDGEFSFRVIN
ncbi:hypothetical protein BG003_000061 [Podila horticola]|nr:hypothetical protein BG003_000061 [Podila horticola]